jgi:hypothetical protein
MFLSEDDTKKFAEVISTAKVMGIESLIIDAESIRGQSDEGTFIISDNTIDQFKQTPIGISRVSVLFSRLNLLGEGKKLPKLELEFKERDNGDKIILRIKIKNVKSSVDFKCADPLMIKAKKVFKDNLIYEFDLNEDTIELMIKSNSAMQTDKIKLILDDGKVFFNINDIEGDSLKHLVTETVVLSDPDKTSFLVNLKNKITLPLFKLALKENDKINIKISEIRNVLNFRLNGLNVYAMPEV